MSDKDPLVPETVAAGRRRTAEKTRQGLREDAGVEEGLDHGLGRAGRAARGPGYAARLRLRARPRLAGGVPLHPRRAADRLPRQALDDAAVRRLRHGEADQRALPLPPRARADRALDGLRPADAQRLRLRPPHGPRRGRQVRRGDRLAPRHGSPLRRHRPRACHDLDDDQLDRADRAGHVPRGGREARDVLGTRSAARSRTTSSRSTSPRRSTSSRPSPRCAS